ncbi:MAG: hypothetical protein U0974_11645 [Gemmatimonadales bacterium]|nr:hypothetical protein [Gemmatimonadales bacterium]
MLPVLKAAKVSRKQWGRSFCCALVVGAAPLAGQGAAPWVDDQDPTVAQIEHLITRGVVRDPSPMIRPWARSALLEALRTATPRTQRDSAMVIRIQLEWEGEVTEKWAMEARGGVAQWSSGRWDLLQPGGPSGEGVWGRLDGALATGKLSLVGSVEADQRLQDDPDWPGRTIAADKAVGFRVPAAYLDVRTRLMALTVGSMPRHWGVVGGPGLALNARAYPRPGAGLRVGGRKVEWEGVVTPLPPQERLDGDLAERTFAAHRLRWSPNSTIDITVWESMVMARPGLSTGEVLERTLTVMAFASQFGRRSDNNTILGGQIAWRPRPGLHLEGQFAGDDIRLGGTNESAGEMDRPDRWAGVLALRGSGLASTSWGVRYERVTAQAFRTSEPAENFVADDIGLVVTVPDYDRITATVGVPVGDWGLVHPTLQWQRQGEGRLDQPVDFSPTGPSFLIGQVTRSVRASAVVEASWRQARLTADIGATRRIGGGWSTSAQMRWSIGGRWLGPL